MAIRIGVGLKAYSAWESGASRPADLPAPARPGATIAAPRRAMD